MKPWTGLATLLTLLALAFLITSASVSNWTETESDQTITEYAPFKVCRTQTGVSVCKRVSDDCTAEFGGTGGMGTVVVGDSCNKVRAVRAFLIISIVLTALSFVAFWIAAHSADPAWMSRMLGVILAFLAAVSGIITMAIWISLQTNTGTDHPTDRQYGYAFALLIAAWVSLLLAACMSMMPSPADLADTTAGHTLAGGMSRMLGGRAGSPHYAGSGYTGAPAGSAAAV